MSLSSLLVKLKMEMYILKHEQKKQEKKYG